MARKDEFEFDIPDKKEKKERPQREEKESKPLFGEGSFLGGLFKKTSSFGNDSSFDDSLFGKEKSNNGRSPIRLKWWHILLIVLGAVIIIAGIVVGIILGQINNSVPGDNVGGKEEEIVEPEGIISSVGTFLPNDSHEYVLCEYTEYFSGEKMTVVQESSDILYDYQPYWVFINETGQHSKTYRGKLSDSSSPEEIKEQVMDMMSNAAGYTPEIIARCDVHVYEPVSFTRVVISSVGISDDGNVTVKYSAGAMDGEMSEEYTLTGTYTKEGNDFSFAYTNLPEDENLLRVAENLLGSAKYESYAQYGSWVNELTFGDYSLYFTTNAEETP